MTAAVSERGLRVLHAIVTDYVASNEPVGSKTLASRYGFGVSAATIRNDMAELEEAELIAAPHTSSGRVPTDKGYRLYVDTLARLRPISRAQRAAIEQFLGASHDIDSVMHASVRLLSQLTNQVAVVQYPSQRHVSVRHIDLIALAPGRVLSIVITGNGRVSQQVVVLPAAEVGEAWVNGLREHISRVAVGKHVSEALRAVRESANTAHQWLNGPETELVQRVLRTVETQLEDGLPEKLSVAGTANLSRSPGMNFGKVLEALEEQVTLLRLFGELENTDIAASIGEENAAYGLSDTAVITGRYTADDGESARVAVLGPTRMDYAANISAVRAVARYLGKLLDEHELLGAKHEWPIITKPSA